MKIKNIALTLGLSALLTACGEPNVEITTPEKIVIHTIEQLNADEESLDSHTGDEAHSVLEPIYKYMNTISPTDLGLAKPQYVRVKLLSDGTYLMIFREAGSIYVSHSVDFMEWTKAERIFSKLPIITADGADKRNYSSPDATVLANGDVLAYCSFYASKGYKPYPEMNGIMMRRSTDNGKTWSKEQVIYQGTTWEPYILQLPSGELNCYFTDTEPNKRNSGTSMVVSTDNGASWSPTGLSNCYKVIRQYKYDNGGTPIYTDQMPVIRMLNDGHTLLGFLEARIETDNSPSGKSYYYMSLVYGKDQWKHLEGNEKETEPIDRRTNVCFGGSGYVGQFHSGETLISCARSNYLSIKIGTSDGRTFRGSDNWDNNDSWYMPFGCDPTDPATTKNMGISGSMEVISSHELLTVQHLNRGGILMGKFYLNHRIDAPDQSVKVDGNNSEWNCTQALFLGSESETQSVIRTAHDNENLYLLVERTDRYINSDDKVELYLQGAFDAALSSNALKLTVYPDKEILVERRKGEVWGNANVVGLACTTAIDGSVGDGRSDTGYLAEIAVPLAAIEATADMVAIDAVMYDSDAVNGVQRVDTFTEADANVPNSWMKIAIK